MSAALAADAVVLVHFAFVAFVVLGGFLTWKWPKVAWLHVPAALWGAYVELSGSLCPLTPLENRLRALAGQSGYEGGFINHYLLPILYPAGLTPSHQLWIGAFVVVLNVVVYARTLRHAHRRNAAAKPG